MVSTATALDHWGSAHGGGIEGADSGFDIEGAVTLGASVYNPSYAARPDNTGLALARYALHADIDLIGRRLSVPVDINLFTDRQRKGFKKLGPTELDVISGLTTTWRLGPGAIELGSRVEHDGPVDQGSFSQTYVDARARYLYSLASVIPSVGDALGEGDISGWLTVGVFAVNPTYAARPDNTGLGLMRYAAHSELSLWKDRVSIGLDATFFSDRKRSGAAKLSPTEIDFTPEIIGRVAPYELHLAYERDMPIDRSGLVQSFVYVLFVYGFDLIHNEPPPLELRHPIPSP
ncbi:MAG: hypothetical protein U0165_19195 [Polyangiaceae bacterium]